MTDKIRKPRTNADAADFWARHLAVDFDCEDRWTNSVHTTANAIYSFGSHFPMAKCWRDVDGRVRRVVVNSDRWTSSKGWADTNGDLDNVRLACEEHSPVPVEYLPLTFNNVEQVYALPKASDPEPTIGYVEIPVPFYVRNPGAEPVDDGVGCIAGTVDVYEVQTSEFDFCKVYGEHPSEYRHPYVRGTMTDAEGVKTYQWGYRSAEVVTRLYGANYSTWSDPHFEAYQAARGRDTYRHDPGLEYKQCEHCKAFKARHEQWRVAMEGTGRGHNPRNGWKLYREMIEMFGDYRTWKSGRKADWDRVKAQRQAHAEWCERNIFSPHQLPRDADGVIMLSTSEPQWGWRPKLHARRKDTEPILRERREAQRKELRLQREREEAERLHRRARRVIERRQRRRARSFEGIAREVVITLANMRGPASNELQSDNNPGGTTQ